MVSVKGRRLVALIAAAIGVMYFTGSAVAATNPFGCRASAEAVRNSPIPATEPFVANRALTPCATDSAGISSGQALGPNTSGATATAGPGGAFTFSSTSQDTSTGPVAPGATALIKLQGGSISTTGSAISLVGPAQAQTSYTCQNGAVVASASSTLTAVNINGSTVSAPSTGRTVSLPGGGSLSINEEIQTGNSLTERLLDLHLPGAADVIVGEAEVTQSSANPCAGTAGDTSPSLGACPKGSTLNAAGDECVIVLSGAGGGAGNGAGGAGGGSGAGGAQVIGVSRPFAGPTGGEVLALSVARKRYKSGCLSGPGPKFAVVGNNGNNRINGTKKADRILGLGGKDRLSGAGGNDCIDGGTGNDRIYGGNGSDRIFGSAGADRISVQNGSSRVDGGAGNDRIVLGNGNDNVTGGSGNDNISVGRGRDSVNGGAGNDRISAGDGNDMVNGGAGNDRILVGNGRDHLFGGTGNDRLFGSGNVIFMNGGKGKDTAFVLTVGMHYAKHHGVERVLKVHTHNL
jgi:Ca2+-binding RTX toxin-like protein